MAYGHPDFPAFVPAKSNYVCALLILSSLVTSTTLGYDGSMMNGLNILPSYADYFNLTTSGTAWNTASVYIGGCLSFAYSKVPDLIGRKWALLHGAILTVIGVVLQAAAQDVPMFVFARVLIGFGTGITALVIPVYLAETLPIKFRAWGLGLVYDCWYVGGLTAAGITYGTANMNTTWAWRLPSLIQGIFSVWCVALLFFTPESPRWLQRQGRTEEAFLALAQSHSDSNVDDAAVRLEMQEIMDTLEFERTHKRKAAVTKVISNPPTRRRLFLASQVALFTMLSGNNIISYYLGDMLDQAGITNSTTQLKINIILNAFCLVVSFGGTACADRFGRKFLGIASSSSCMVLIFLVGGLTKAYGTSNNTSGVYGTVASIFLFQGAYSFGWTPLSVLYPPEVMNYEIRSIGMGLCTFLTNAAGLMVTFAFPYALAAIGWKTYMINGAWDVIQLVIVVITWVETKGRTLEEIDEIFDGEMHSRVHGRVATLEGVDPEQEAAVFEEQMRDVQPVDELKKHVITDVKAVD